MGSISQRETRLPFILTFRPGAHIAGPEKLSEGEAEKLSE